MDRLIAYMERETDIGRMRQITRADVLRHALDLGIEVLEHRAAMAAHARWEEDARKARG